MQIDTAFLSSQGGRSENQDYVLEKRLPSHEANCWVVADGLGGHQGGEVASKLATDSLAKDFEEAFVNEFPIEISKWIDNAQTLLSTHQASSTDLAEMRTTIVLLLQTGKYAEWSHCGDSRFYWFRDGELEIQSEDHSVPQALVKLGQLLPEEIRSHEDRNRVTQCLGSPGGVTCSSNPTIEIEDGCAFILCSDGFWEYVFEPEMLIDLAKANGAQHWLDLMYARLISRSPSGADNCSVIVGMFSSPSNEQVFDALADASPESST